MRIGVRLNGEARRKGVKEPNRMSDLILNASTLPEPLSRMIQTDRVRVWETDGEIRLAPVEEGFSESQSRRIGYADVGFEEKIARLNVLRGSGSDLEMTVDSFIATTHDKTEI
jgi:hypothetical protein